MIVKEKRTEIVSHDINLQSLSIEIVTFKCRLNTLAFKALSLYKFRNKRKELQEVTFLMKFYFSNAAGVRNAF